MVVKNRKRSRKSKQSSWVKHVKAYARENGMSYKDALKAAKASYNEIPAAVAEAVAEAVAPNALAAGNLRRMKQVRATQLLRRARRYRRPASRRQQIRRGDYPRTIQFSRPSAPGHKSKCQLEFKRLLAKKRKTLAELKESRASLIDLERRNKER